jgi:hypothetical protein
MMAVEFFGSNVIPSSINLDSGSVSAGRAFEARISRCSRKSGWFGSAFNTPPSGLSDNKQETKSLTGDPPNSIVFPFDSRISISSTRKNGEIDSTAAMYLIAFKYVE